MSNNTTNNFGSLGSVKYGSNIAQSIIELAVEEINGVAGLAGPGVVMQRIGDTLNVDISLNVANNENCPEIAYRIQENVKRSVETMSIYKLGKININILAVDFKAKLVTNTL